MTESSSKKTVTDNRCQQALRKFTRTLEKEYERMFPHIPATEELWERLGGIDEKLTKALARRPLTPAEIRSFGDRAYKALRQTMLKVAKSIKQPRYVDCVHIETRQVRPWPCDD